MFYLLSPTQVLPKNRHANKENLPSMSSENPTSEESASIINSNSTANEFVRYDIFMKALNELKGKMEDGFKNNDGISSRNNRSELL